MRETLESRKLIMTDRNIADVIDQIKAIVPIAEDKLINSMNWVRQDSLYRPPEDSYESWKMLQQTLLKVIKIPKEEWQFEALSIFSMVPIERIKREASLLPDSCDTCKTTHEICDGEISYGSELCIDKLQNHLHKNQKYKVIASKE